MIQFMTFSFNPFGECCSIVWDSTREAIIIDPGCYDGDELGTIYDFVGGNNLKIKAIWLTHGHFDHIYGVSALVKEYGVPVYMNPADGVILDNAATIATMFGMKVPDTDFKTVPAVGGDSLRFGESTFKVIATAGHTPGGICLWNEDADLLFTGDTLFAGSIGRTDSPWGDYDKLIVGIMDSLMGLPGNTIVVPGHGSATDIATERTHNPFLQPFNEPGGDELDWDMEGLELDGIE